MPATSDYADAELETKLRPLARKLRRPRLGGGNPGQNDRRHPQLTADDNSGKYTKSTCYELPITGNLPPHFQDGQGCHGSALHGFLPME